jgi:hypothetical protein
MEIYFLSLSVVIIVGVSGVLAYVGYTNRKVKRHLQSLSRVAEQRSTYPVRR